MLCKKLAQLKIKQYIYKKLIMTAKNILIEWLLQTDQTNFKEGHYFVIEEAMKEYTRLKCQELLEIVAEKADKAHVGGWDLDRDEVLSAVDLEKFCS